MAPGARPADAPGLGRQEGRPNPLIQGAARGALPTERGRTWRAGPAHRRASLAWPLALRVPTARPAVAAPGWPKQAPPAGRDSPGAGSVRQPRGAGASSLSENRPESAAVLTQPPAKHDTHSGRSFSRRCPSRSSLSPLDAGRGRALRFPDLLDRLCLRAHRRLQIELPARRSLACGPICAGHD